MTQSATSDLEIARRGLRWIAALFALFVLLGPVIVGRIGHPGVLSPGAGVNTFFEQYRRHEPIFLALTAVFAIGMAVAAGRVRPCESADTAAWSDRARWGVGQLTIVAILVVAITALGSGTVMHGIAFSMDEYVAAFQAQIFASGQRAAPLPSSWAPFAVSLAPVYVSYDPERHVWMSQYLPLYSGLRALFLSVGLDRFLNPALAGASVMLVYACARRLWPEHRSRAWLAAGFLASSCQFLFMSMTGFAMPAHLAVNLLWLWAFLRNDRAGWLAAPLIGAVALGLHNPFSHALFVAPFLVYILWQRRWSWTAYFSVVYLAGIAFWYAWAKSVHMGGEASFSGVFRSPGLLMMAVQELSLTVILTWQTPVLAVALLWVAFAWRTLPVTERLLAAGVLLSFAFFSFFPSTQGHGWGYRYTYPVLGNIALLGVCGIGALSSALGSVTVRRMLVASAFVTVFVQWPVRAWQIERYVRPFAQVHDYIAHIDADVVIVDPTASWYGFDLIRNDPFLAGTPKVLSAFNLHAVEKQALAARFGDRVHMLTPGEIGQFGIPLYRSRFRKPPWP